MKPDYNLILGNIEKHELSLTQHVTLGIFTELAKCEITCSGITLSPESNGNSKLTIANITYPKEVDTSLIVNKLRHIVKWLVQAGEQEETSKALSVLATDIERCVKPVNKDPRYSIGKAIRLLEDDQPQLAQYELIELDGFLSAHEECSYGPPPKLYAPWWYVIAAFWIGIGASLLCKYLL